MTGHCEHCADIIGILVAMRALVDGEARTTASDTVRHRAQGASDTLGYILKLIRSGQHGNGGDT